jgi:ABC-type multidrug transport system ATPase subunit
VLEADGVTKSYGDLQALAPLKLTLKGGQLAVLVGHNGSGKSTFLGLASGLLEPTAGSIKIAGHAAGSFEARGATSYLADNPILYDDLSVMEHLEYVARLHGVEDWEDRAHGLLAHLGLSHRADDLPSRFSRGLRQKSAIAVAMIRPFSLLLVDEPFVGLDPQGREAMVSLLQEAHESGAAVIVATHQLDFVQRAERCLALRDGELVFDGPANGADVDSLVLGENG